MAALGPVPEIRLRRASVDDVGEIITVQRAAFLVEAQTYGHPNLPPLSETIDEAHNVLDDQRVVVTVAELVRATGPRIVGVVRATSADGVVDVGRLAVAPDLMGSGVGSRLLQHVHDHAPVGTERFTLFTGAKSLANHTWYAGHGYLRVGSLVDSMGIEVTVMERPLLLARPAVPGARVAAYVVRADTELLVFEHVDAPDAGTQVPAGGIGPGESVRQAALREVLEETGVTARFASLLGYADSPHPESGAMRRTAYVHLTADRDVGERWHHVVAGTGADAGMQFWCRWAPFDVRLADDQAAFVGAISGSAHEDVRPPPRHG